MSVYDINDLNITQIKISNPKKIDNCLHSKLKYMDEKFILKVPCCKFIDIKNKNNLHIYTFKLDSKSTLSFNLFEEHVVESLEKRNHYWNDLDIYEAFQKNIKSSAKFGTVLSIRFRSLQYEDLINKTIDLYVRPSLLKCNDKIIKINWQLVEIKVNETDLFLEENDYIDSDIPGPYEDEIKMLKENLIQKITEIEIYLNDLKNRVENQDPDIENDITEIYYKFVNLTNTNN